MSESTEYVEQWMVRFVYNFDNFKIIFWIIMSVGLLERSRFWKFLSLSDGISDLAAKPLHCGLRRRGHL